MVHKGVYRSFPCAAQCARACARSECSAWRKCRQQLPHSLADVGVLFSGLAATPSSDRAKTHARAKEHRSASDHGNGTRDTMRTQVGAIHRIARAFCASAWAIEVNRPYL